LSNADIIAASLTGNIITTGGFWHLDEAFYLYEEMQEYARSIGATHARHMFGHHIKINSVFFAEQDNNYYVVIGHFNVTFKDTDDIRDMALLKVINTLEE